MKYIGFLLLFLVGCHSKNEAELSKELYKELKLGVNGCYLFSGNKEAFASCIDHLFKVVGI